MFRRKLVTPTAVVAAAAATITTGHTDSHRCGPLSSSRFTSAARLCRSTRQLKSTADYRNGSSSPSATSTALSLSKRGIAHTSTSSPPSPPPPIDVNPTHSKKGQRNGKQSVQPQSIHRRQPQRKHPKKRRAAVAATGEAEEEPLLQTINLGNGIQAVVATSLPHLREASAAFSQQQEGKEKEKGKERGILPSTSEAQSASDAAVVVPSSAGIQEAIAHVDPTALLDHVYTVSSLATADALAAAFTELQRTSLPALAHLAASCGPDGRLPAATLQHLLHHGNDSGGLAAVSRALRNITQVLEAVEDSGRQTGRRYEAAFPAALTEAVWRLAGPVLQQLQAAVVDARRGRARAAEERDASEGAVAVVSEATALQAQKAFLADFRAARRALAVRTRAVADALAPEQLVHTIAYMQLCGALADDILGPIGAHLVELQAEAQRPAQQVSRNYSLLAHHVATLPEVPLPITPAAAMALARVLGRQAAPGHAHLHRLLHTTLLPALLPELAAAAAGVAEGHGPTEAALVDLTTCFVKYEVSGSGVDYLVALWAPRVGQLAPLECAKVLHLLSQRPAALSGNPRRARTKGSRDLTDLHSPRQKQDVVLAQQAEFARLIEALCERVVQQGREVLQQLESSTGAALTEEAAAAVVASTQDWLQLLTEVLRVNSVHWGEVYHTAASVVYARLLQVAALPAVDLDVALPLPVAQRVVQTLLRRNTLIPDHPLHRLLLKRLLYAPETEKDAALASVALLGLELMVLPEEGEDTSAAAQIKEKDEKKEKEKEEGRTAVTLAGFLAHYGLQEHSVVTPQDRQQALALFRRHGKALKLTAFIAGMSAAPLQQLPALAQQRVMNHLTEIASSVHPHWLVRGMVAATEKMGAVVDPLSVQRWYSRFTARDIVRHTNTEDCIHLLHILALKEDYQVNNAVAKHAIVRHVGVLLTRESDAVDAGGVVPLEAVPDLIAALRAGHVFYSHLFSRLCRLLLAQVQTAPLEAVLPAFHATAEEYARRAPGEGRGTVFRDVWELLRGRLIPQAHLLQLDEVLAALNGFAALDNSDRPVFLVLVHRLWELTEGALAAAADQHPALEDEVQEVRLAGSSTPEADADEAARLQQRAAALGQHVCQRLTPSATAVLVTALLHWQHAGAAEVLLPWGLLQLRQTCHDLYPIDLVQLLPHLLRTFAELEDGATAPPAAQPYLATLAHHLALLHRAYDGCRSMFLFLYGVNAAEQRQLVAESLQARSSTAEKAEEVQAAGAPAPPSALEVSSVDDLVRASAEMRALWSAKVRFSVLSVPPALFAAVLIELAGSRIYDRAMGLACLRRLCHRRRACEAELGIEALVDTAMAACVLRQTLPAPPPTAQEAQTAEAAADALAEMELTEEAFSVAFNTYMTVILTALWNRADELSAAQVDALLRCLHYYYGEKVDEDFVQRLQEQKTLLQRREARPKEKQHEQAREEKDGGAGGKGEEAGEKEEQKRSPQRASAKPATAAATPPLAPLVELRPEDLFDL